MVQQLIVVVAVENNAKLEFFFIEYLKLSLSLKLNTM